MESLAADVLLFFLAVLLGQIAGGKIYQQGSSVSWVFPLALLALLLALFAAVYTGAAGPAAVHRSQ